MSRFAMSSKLNTRVNTSATVWIAPSKTYNPKYNTEDIAITLNNKFANKYKIANIITTNTIILL